MTEQSERVSIKDWPKDERPREKAVKNGIASLSKSELLAILIGSGSVDESAVALMKKVLASCKDSISELSKRSIDDLCSFKGIGQAKALTIAAACELWKRRQDDEIPKIVKINSSKDLFDYFFPILCDATTEEAYILLLSTRNVVIDHVHISSGGFTSTAVDIRCIIREALLKRSVTLALCHNHPSGNKQPSGLDDKLTFDVAEACHIMNIRFLDHVVFTETDYYSYKDANKI